jgi:hypothetical protein
MSSSDDLQQRRDSGLAAQSDSIGNFACSCDRAVPVRAFSGVFLSLDMYSGLPG